MNILKRIEQKYDRKPLNGKNILLCTHATDATTEFIKTLSYLGACIFYVPVEYSKKKSSLYHIQKITNNTIIEKMDFVQKIMPEIDIIIEDGMRISKLIYDNPKNYKLKKNLYCIEQTTSGIRNLEAKLKSQIFLYPVINVAESHLKLGVENSLSTPESILSSFMKEKSFTFTQKNILVLGYGHIGGGIAKLCRAHGSHVTVVDNDSVKRTLAASHGFYSVDVTKMNEIISDQNLIISCTSNREGFCLETEQFLLMSNGAMIINAGSGRGEISQDMLNPRTFKKNRAKINVSKKGDNLICTFTKMGMKKTVEILCSAHPINLRCGDGTSKDVMDFVFSLMVMILIKTKPQKLTSTIHFTDRLIEEEIASLWEYNSYDVGPQLIKSEELHGEPRPWGNLYRFISNKNNLKRFSLVRASFKSGSNTDGHYHLTAEEAYIMEKGTADIVTWDPKNPDHNDEIKFKVKPGDYLTIPKGRAHRVFVTSKEDFECLVIASPPFSFWDQFFPLE